MVMAIAKAMAMAAQPPELERGLRALAGMIAEAHLKRLARKQAQAGGEV